MSRNVRIAGQRTRTKSATTRLVLFALAAHANRDLLAWPKQATLAELCGTTDRTVRTALRELEALGEVRALTRGQGRGSTVYRVSILASNFDVMEDT